MRLEFTTTTCALQRQLCNELEVRGKHRHTAATVAAAKQHLPARGEYVEVVSSWYTRKTTGGGIFSRGLGALHQDSILQSELHECILDCRHRTWTKVQRGASFTIVKVEVTIVTITHWPSKAEHTHSLAIVACR